MIFLFENFVESRLAEATSAGATTLRVAPSDTQRLPQPDAGDDERVALVLFDGVQMPEVVHVTVNPRDGTLTVERGREGTAAQTWKPGTAVLHALTKESIAYFASGGSADYLNQVNERIDNAFAEVEALAQARVDDQAAFAQYQISVTSSFTASAASVQQLSQAFSDISSSWATYQTMVNSSVGSAVANSTFAMNSVIAQGEVTAGLEVTVSAMLDGVSAATFAEKIEGFVTADQAQVTINEDVDTRLGDAETSLSEEITLRSTQFLAQANINSTVEATLGDQAAALTDEIELRATETFALAERTTALETSVDTPTTGLLARMSTEESLRTSQTNALASRADTLEATATLHGGRLDDLETGLGGTEGDLVALEARVTTEETATADLYANKASAASVTTLSATVTTETANRVAGDNGLQTQIDGKAASSTVTALDARVTTAESAIVDLNANKASASSVSTLSASLTTETSNRTAADAGLQTQIDGKASTTSVTTLTGRVTTAEAAIVDLDNTKAETTSVTTLESNFRSAVALAIPEKVTDANGSQFTAATVGSPDSVAELGVSNVQNLAGFGYASKVNGTYVRGVVDQVATKVYEVEVELECTAYGGAAWTPRIAIRSMNSDYTNNNSANVLGSAVSSTGVVTLKNWIASTALANFSVPGSAWPGTGTKLRFGASWSGGAGSTIYIRRITVKDVTAVYQAELAAKGGQATSALLLPSTFDQDGKFWHSLASAAYYPPGSLNAPDLNRAGTTVTYPTVSGLGKVLDAAGYILVAPKGFITLQPQRTYTATRRVRGTVDAVGGNNQSLGTWYVFDGAGGYLGIINMGAGVTLTCTVAAGWQQAGHSITTETVLATYPTAVHIVPTFSLNQTGGTPGTSQLAWFRVEDTTQATNAAASVTQAQKEVRLLVPEYPDSLSAYFCNAAAGSPDTVGSVPAADIVNQAGYGYVYQFSNAGGHSVFYIRQPVRYVTGMVIEVTAEVECTSYSGTPFQPYLYMYGLDGSYSVTTLTQVGFTTNVNATGVVTMTRRFRIGPLTGESALPAASTFYRCGVYVGAAVGASVLRLRRLSVKDVTTLAAAEQAALNSRTYASNTGGVSRLDATGSYHTESDTGDPITVSSPPSARIENVAGFGYAWNNGGTITGLHTRVAAPTITGRQYQVVAEVELVTANGATPTARVQLRGLTSAYAGHSTAQGPTSTLIVGQVTTITCDFGATAPPGGVAWTAGSVWQRAGVVFGAMGAAVIRVRSLRIDDITNVIASNARITTLETTVNTPTTGLAARTTTLETTINTPTTGLSARMSTAETAITSLTTGKASVSSVTALEVTVSDIQDDLEGAIEAATLLTGRVDSAETAIADLETNKVEVTVFSALEATATAKAKTYAQDNAPATGLVIGDLWIDTNDSNKLYRWNGTSWINLRDAGISQALTDAAAAITDAAGAQATADGKVTTFIQTSAPTADGVGDLWLDSDDGNKLYRWSGSAWDLVADTRIATAITNASTAQSTANSKITTFYQTSSPTALATGDLWIDTDDNNKLYRWSGSAWVAANDTRSNTFVQTSAPSSGMITGDLWFDSDDNNKQYRYNGSSWIAVDDNRIATATSNITSLQTSVANLTTGKADASVVTALTTTVSGKVTTFAQTSAPAATATGDIWIDTDDNNKMYRWSGSAWVAVNDTRSAVYAQTAAPSSGMLTGDLWVDTDDGNKMYRYSGSAWVAIDDGRIATATSNITTLQTTTANLQTGKADASVVTALTSTVNGHTSTLSSQATTIADHTGKLEAYFDWHAAAGGEEAYATVKASDTGSEINLAAKTIGLFNLVAGIATKIFELDGDGIPRFSRPIEIQAAGAKLVLGPGFGADDDLVFWAGPTMDQDDMSKANATIWFDVDGDGYFGGTLSAGVLKNAAQTSSLSTTASVTLGPFGTNGNPKSIVVSWTYSGHVYRDNNPTPTISIDCEIKLYRVSPSGETLLHTETVTNAGSYSSDAAGSAEAPNPYGGSNGIFDYKIGWGASSTFTFTDTNASTSDFTYRVDINRTESTVTISGSDLQPAVTTQRVSVISTEE